MKKQSIGVNDMVFTAKEMMEYARAREEHGVSIGEWLSQRPKRKLSESETAYALLRACCAVTGADFNKALSRSRKPENVRARYFAMSLFKDRFPLVPLREVGAYFLRDHSTVSHAYDEIERISDLRYKDPAYELLVQANKEVTMNLQKYVSI